MSLRGGEAFELDDPRRMLEELEEDVDTRTKAAVQRADDNDHPRRMLAELEHNIDMRTKATAQREVDNDDDLEVLRKDMATMFSPPPEGTVQNFHTNIAPPPHFDLTFQSQRAEKNHQLDQEAVPYAVALQLERAGTSWDEVQRWTEYLFSEGRNGYADVAAKHVYIEKSLLDLNIIIKQTLAKEATYQAVEEKAGLPCRLIATNLAADADEKALADLFCEFRYDM